MLKITKSGFPSITLDNDARYLSYLFTIIEKVDKDAEIKIIKDSFKCSVFLSASQKSLRNQLIKEIKELHFILGLSDCVQYSKSLNISNYISWILILG